MPEKYCEIRIKGQSELIKGFVIGFFEGRGRKEDSLIEEEGLIEKDSPIDLIKHFFDRHHHLVSIIIETELYKPLVGALARHKTEIRGTVDSVREVTGASFRFHYRTYSRETGNALLALFAELPQGVRIQDYAPSEKLDPDGKGVEAYAPLHEYQVSAKGTISGGVKEVYDLLRRAGRFDVVEVGELELVYGKELI
jgi:hypothetical protein